MAANLDFFPNPSAFPMSRFLFLCGTALVGLTAGGRLRADDSASAQVWQYLTAESAASVHQNYKSPITDRSISNNKLTINGVPYSHGLGTHAPSEIVYNLERTHKKFSAKVGLDDGGGAPGSVIFKVVLDGKEAFNSGPMTYQKDAQEISLDLTGVKAMHLVTEMATGSPQGDHADWVDAKIDGIILPKPVPHFSTAGFFAVDGAARTVADFNPGWRFHKGDVPDAQNPNFNDAGWEAANLPHGLEILGENESGGRNYQGPAWYRKKFQAAADGGKVYLYFEAVMGKCTVWINGKKMAEHFGGYLPFAIDAGPALNADGKNNIVAVRADNSDDPAYPPGKAQNNLDFTYLGGIYRDVYLIRTPAVHVTLPEISATPAGGGVFVATKDVSGSDANLEVRTEVANEGLDAKKLTIRSVLETAEGADILKEETAVDLPAGAAKEITQALAPKNVHLWSPDDPYLHFLRTEIVENGKIVDTLKTRLGIRLFEMRGPAGFFVNKKPIGTKLSGVNRHQDYAFVGNAVPNSGQWRDVKLLRDGGSNVIRAAHYPMDPAFYDACDELGMLVTTANPGWQFFNFKDPLFAQRLVADTRALVRRDRNHPAMLLWEVSLNETPEETDDALKEMNRVANEEYPFPGFYTVADQPEAKRGGLNFYYHGSDPVVNSFTREYGDGGEVDSFNAQNAVTRVKREWGESALLGQAAIRARGLDFVYNSSPIRLGGALWCGIDHQRGYHPDPFLGGLLDSVRIPRYSYYLFKSQYSPSLKIPGVETGPMVKITNELTQISGPDVIVYSNCEEVRLTWLGQVVGTQKPDAQYPHEPHPPFTFKSVFDFSVIPRDWRQKTSQIEMVAEGLIGGQVVAREVKKYAERTSGVALTIDDDGTGLTADGSDFVPLRATIVDEKGVPKVLATEDVYFKVEGPGEIIGGPATQSNPARTEFGVATALLRAGTRPGVIKITAYASGLAPGEAYAVSVPPAHPLAYDTAYAAASKPADNGAILSIQTTSDQATGDVAELKAKLHQLQLDLTSKQQDLMELRSKTAK